MAKSTLDRRTKYTKMVLQNSLFELLKQKSIDKITVTDICHLADINRGTFYYYYTDVFDLLNQIENELYENFLVYFNQYLESSDRNTYLLMIKLFEYLKQEKKIFKIFFSQNGDKDFIKRVYLTAYTSVIEEWKSQKTNLDPQQLDKIFLFVANGSISLIQNWFDTGLKESPEELASFINNLCEFGYHHFLKKEKN